MTAPADFEWPPFNGFLLWYAILHCVGAVALFAAFTVAGAVVVTFGVVDPAMIEQRAIEIQLLWTAVSAVFAVTLVFIVGRRHRISLRQGFLGFFAASVLSWVDRLPLTAGSWVAAGSFPYVRNLPAVVALVLAYGFVLTIVIWRKRRRSLNRRRRAALVEPST